MQLSTSRIIRPSDCGLRYTVRLAQDQADLAEAQALRYQVFNLELGEGLAQSHQSGRDQDQYDTVYDHLLVEHARSRRVIGTYRLQPGARARRQLGFYSAAEFDLAPLAPLLDDAVELGRACVHAEHRNLAVLTLLWRGIGAYAETHAARYLFGCSSLDSQDAVVGASVYAALYRRHLVEPRFRIKPWPACECPLDRLSDDAPSIPKLLRAYLGIGATICGPPALDREFGTIDFLTFLDLQALAPAARDRFLAANNPLNLG